MGSGSQGGQKTEIVNYQLSLSIIFMKLLPLGTQHFGQLREKGAIYVDKTQLICQLIREYQAVFLSRPRRFGKSLLLSTIAELHSGNRGIFAVPL